MNGRTAKLLRDALNGDDDFEHRHEYRRFKKAYNNSDVEHKIQAKHVARKIIKSGKKVKYGNKNAGN